MVCPGLTPKPGRTLGGQGWEVPANFQRTPGKRSPPVRARCLLELFPDSVERAIIIAVYGFCQFSRRKLEGTSPTRTVRQGSSHALPVTASTGTSGCPLRDAELPGLSPAPPALASMRERHPHRAGAGHRHRQYHLQGGKNRKPHGNPGPGLFGPTHSPSAKDRALTPHIAAGTDFASGRFLTSRRRCSAAALRQFHHSAANAASPGR